MVLYQTEKYKVDITMDTTGIIITCKNGLEIRVLALENTMILYPYNMDKGSVRIQGNFYLKPGNNNVELKEFR